MCLGKAGGPYLYKTIFIPYMFIARNLFTCLFDHFHGQIAIDTVQGPFQRTHQTTVMPAKSDSDVILSLQL